MNSRIFKSHISHHSLTHSLSSLQPPSMCVCVYGAAHIWGLRTVYHTCVLGGGGAAEGWGGGGGVSSPPSPYIAIYFTTQSVSSAVFCLHFSLSQSDSYSIGPTLTLSWSDSNPVSGPTLTLFQSDSYPVSGPTITLSQSEPRSNSYSVSVRLLLYSFDSYSVSVRLLLCLGPTLTLSWSDSYSD